MPSSRGSRHRVPPPCRRKTADKLRPARKVSVSRALAFRRDTKLAAATIDAMIVVRLNTDAAKVIRCGDHDWAVIPQIRRVIRLGGGPVPGHPEWEFQCTCSLDEGSFCIFLTDQYPTMLGMVCGAASEAEATWNRLEGLYLRAADEVATIDLLSCRSGFHTYSSEPSAMRSGQ